MKKKIGYYWVKFYNKELKICFWNGLSFECFVSDYANDEIESYTELTVPDEIYFICDSEIVSAE